MDAYLKRDYKSAYKIFKSLGSRSRDEFDIVFDALCLTQGISADHRYIAVCPIGPPPVVDLAEDGCLRGRPTRRLHATSSSDGRRWIAALEESVQRAPSRRSHLREMGATSPIG